MLTMNGELESSTKPTSLSSSNWDIGMNNEYQWMGLFQMDKEWRMNEKKSTQPKLAIYNLAILLILSQTPGTRYPKKIVCVHPETREFFAASQPHHGVWIRSFGVKSTISDMIIICMYIYIYR